MRLDGKVALITGAGSGMGRVAAQLFAREGARVVAADLDERAGRETEALARDAGLEVRFVRADVSREADCRGMVAFAEETFGKLDVLYNNAGILPEADIPKLIEMGVARVFTPGTTMQEIVDFLKNRSAASHA